MDYLKNKHFAYGEELENELIRLAVHTKTVEELKDELAELQMCDIILHHHQPMTSEQKEKLQARRVRVNNKIEDSLNVLETFGDWEQVRYN